MPINPRSSARMDEFLATLAKCGVRAMHLGRSDYRINSLRVSIRTTTKPGPVFWYDISASTLGNADYFIYQTASQFYFCLFPSAFFSHHYSSLQDSNRPHAKQFYIDWANKRVLSHPVFSEGIAAYCCAISPTEMYGKWREVFNA